MEYRTKLEKAIKERKINQTRMAIDLDITKQAINHWTRGDNTPNLNNMKRVCKYLEMDFKDLWL